MALNGLLLFSPRPINIVVEATPDPVEVNIEEITATADIQELEVCVNIEEAAPCP